MFTQLLLQFCFCFSHGEADWLFISLQMGTPASSGLSVSPARPAAPILPKAPVVIDQSDMYTNVFSRFADRHTKDGNVVGMFASVFECLV
jgi:hypothetical protein